MPRVRGKTAGAYATDGVTLYKVNVDADRFLDAHFAWGAVTPPLPLLPRGFKARHVTGLSATSGRRAIAMVPHVSSDVWTGTTTTFDVEADDGTIDVMTIINRIGEKPSLP